MRKNKTFFVCALLSCSIMCSSCIGSFKLWNGLLEWNKSLGNKFVNELVFIALNIVPVYGIASFADILVLNTIEFWSGSNPMAANEAHTKKVLFFLIIKKFYKIDNVLSTKICF